MSLPHDNQENTYTQDWLTFYRAHENAVNVIISARVKYIQGENEGSNAFINCKNTLQSFSFEDNPNLVEIQKYAFYQCTNLQSIDLSPCKKLTIIGQYAFQSCKNVISLILPENLLEIRDYCFSALSQLPSVVIPDSLTHLNTRCFFYCTSLKTFTINPTSNLRFLMGNFIRKSLITEFTITANVELIAAAAFEEVPLKTFSVSQNNKNYVSDWNLLLTKNKTVLIAAPMLLTGTFTVPNGIEVLEGSSFAYSNLELINFPNTLKIIRHHCFYVAKSLKKVVIPDSVTEVQNSAFQYCNKLSEVKMSENVTNLSPSCFNECNLSSFTIPSKVTSIGNGCFVSNPYLKRIVLPNSVKTLVGTVFDPNVEIVFGENSNFYLDSQKLILTKDNLTVISYLGPDTNQDITIIDTITNIGKNAFISKGNLNSISFDSKSKLISIENYAFQNCRKMKFINVPTTVTSVGSYAFDGCENLDSISFNSLNYLGQYAFSNCKKLSQMNLFASSITKIDVSCFSGCISLASFNLPENLQSIQSNAFSDTTRLTSIVFGSKISELLDSCFSNSGLQSVDLSNCNNLIHLSPFCFQGCSSLNELILPSNLQVIDISALSNTQIISLEIPQSLKRIETSAFQNCSSLTTFDIPADSLLEFIGLYAFRDCMMLKTINCPERGTDHFKVLTGALYNYDMTNLILFPPASPITYFSLPGSVSSIDQGAFIGCKNLLSVLIPSGSVSRISANAFEGCSRLTYINIPLCVRSVGENAFLGCSSLICGVQIENASKTFINDVISKAGLPPSSYKQCVGNIKSCKTYYQSRFDIMTYTVMIVI